MPQSADALRFFTRYVKQAGALQHISAVPWRQRRGHDIHLPTRAPFCEMWGKAERCRTPQEHLLPILYAPEMPMSSVYKWQIKRPWEPAVTQHTPFE